MMERKVLRTIQISLVALLLSHFSFGQTGFTEDFNDNSLAAGWVGSGIYTLSESNQELGVAVALPATSYNIFYYNISAQDLSSNPYLKIKVKSSQALKLRIDFEDINGKVTNASAINQDVLGNNTYQTLTYNFSGRFSQSWPSASAVDASQIVKVIVFVNAGGAAFNGTIYLDDLLVGSATGILPPPGDIKLNQIGFYPNGPKIAIGITGTAGPFYILSEDLQDTVYTGTLGASASFAITGETVRKADFTDFDSVGNFYLNIPGIGNSHPFKINPAIHHEVSKAGMKGFYYQRASTALPAVNAGAWARAKGHSDNSVYVHNSAANGYRPANTVISSPRGWYDAGDYNKYIVNAGFSTFMILSMYEHYPSYFDTLNLNIPESGNAIPDVLDEALWEIRWFLSMQDPYDGGVYSKLTSPNFDGTIMPSASSQARYVVQKSTAATLDFAATLAQAARILKLYEAQLPGLADSCINASVKAWRWARKNPNVQYVQSLLSNPAINTGEYGDNTFTDEFQWAGMELYATTKVDSFYTLSGSLTTISPAGWANVRSLGYLSLAHLRKQLTNVADTTNIKNQIISQANYLKGRAVLSPYGTSMYDSWAFNWGSNGLAATHGALLLNAFDFTKDSSYFKVALANMDYLMGRNGANYCFVTGFGDVSPMDIHHRPSSADGIAAPVPGLLAGGPNTDSPSDCGASAYPSTFRGKSYLDAYCSYSTNEIAINWNAPFAYLSNVIEAIEAGATSELLNYSAVLPTNIVMISDTLTLVVAADVNQMDANFGLSVYPNPAKDRLTVDFNNTSESVSITLTDVRGMKVLERDNNKLGAQSEQFDVQGLNKGLYYLILKSTSKTEARKVMVE